MRSPYNPHSNPFSATSVASCSNLLHRNTKVIVEQNLGDDSKLTSTANPDRESLRLVRCGRSGFLPVKHREPDQRVCTVEARDLLHPHSRLAILPTCRASVGKR